MLQKEVKELRKIFKKEDQRMVYMFNALGDMCRFKIMKLLLGNKDLCVGNIAEACGVTDSAASQHLRVLEMTGLIRKKRMGQRTCFEIRKDNKAVKYLMSLIIKS